MCPKCGAKMSNPTYVASGNPPNGYRRGCIVEKEVQDVLRRACARCGYEQDEEPIGRD